ncbi:MAG: hypothetical protein HWN68_17065 [Desulfobacterales bacterium]|nr:hypothetical protein [Desulfobacterales bacterium]
MPRKRKLLVPDNQLTLIDIEPEPPREKKPRVKRIDSLEERVTHLEAEVTLVSGQLDREEDLDEEDD